MIVGDTQEALETIQIAINREPQNSRFWSAMGRYATAVAGEHPDQRPSEILSDIVDPSKEDAQALLFVARLYAQLGDGGASRETYRHVLRLNPGNREAQEALDAP